MKPNPENEMRRSEMRLEELRGKGCFERGRRCPHCDGTGRVFVHDDNHGPIYSRPVKEWHTRGSHACGMCGGDGWIDPDEEWDDYGIWASKNEKPQTVGKG